MRKKERRYKKIHNYPLRIPAEGTPECREWRRKHKIRAACTIIYVRAIKKNLLPHWRGKLCVDCGKPAQCYDHRNYHYPLRVDPVCQRCNCKRGEGYPYLGTQTEKNYREQKELRC